jgi:hypothetical protein
MQSSRASISFITPAQVKTIHTLVSRLRVDDDTYRGMLSGYGVESCKDLMKWQAGELITALSNLGKQQGIKPAPVKKVYGTGERGKNKHLTDDQAQRIEILAMLLGWLTSPQPSPYKGEGEERPLPPSGTPPWQSSPPCPSDTPPLQGEKRLVGFIERQTGAKRAVQMLTNEQASKVIVGMQRVLASKMAGKFLLNDVRKHEIYAGINNMSNAELKEAIKNGVQEQVQVQEQGGKQ